MRRNLKAAPKLQFAIGAALLGITICFLAGYFIRLTIPRDEYRLVDLRPEAGLPQGWTYQVNGALVEPVFSAEGYFQGISMDAPTPVTMRRVMREARDEAYLHFNLVDAALQVFMDETVLYTDFPGAVHDPAQPVTWVEEQREHFAGFRSVYAALPEDYVGHTLTVVFYPAELYDGGASPSFPQLYDRYGDMPMLMSDSVLPLVMGAAAGVLAILLLLLYCGGAMSGGHDPAILLLALFAVLCTVVFTMQSWPEVFSLYMGDTQLGLYLQAVYADLLLLYFACRMQRVKAWILTGAVGVHALVQLVQVVKGGGSVTGSTSGAWFLALLLLAFVLFFIERKRQFVFRILLWSMLPLAFALAAAYVAGICGYGNEGYPMVSSALGGSFVAINRLVSLYLALVSIVVLSAGYVKERVRKAKEAQLTSLQKRFAEENAAVLQQSLEQSMTERHEFRHHIEAIRALYDGAQNDRLADYLENLSKNMIEPLQYSKNSLVNALVTPRLKQAKELGAKVSVTFQVPERLGLEDADLAVLLSNLLDNAVEALAGVSDPSARRLQLKIGIYNEVGLTISCENSFSGDLSLSQDGTPQTTKSDRSAHGFGISAMRQVAQKYGSILLLEHDASTFSATTCLFMRESVGVE